QVSDRDIAPALAFGPTLLEHPIGLAHSRGHADEDLQVSAPLRHGRIVLDTLSGDASAATGSGDRIATSRLERSPRYYAGLTPESAVVAIAPQRAHVQARERFVGRSPARPGGRLLRLGGYMSPLTALAEIRRVSLGAGRRIMISAGTRSSSHLRSS